MLNEIGSNALGFSRVERGATCSSTGHKDKIIAAQYQCQCCRQCCPDEDGSLKAILSSISFQSRPVYLLDSGTRPQVELQLQLTQKQLLGLAQVSPPALTEIVLE
jgi:hypothetical protein